MNKEQLEGYKEALADLDTILKQEKMLIKKRGANRMNLKAKARLNRIENLIQNLKLKRRKLLGTTNWLAPKMFKRKERRTIIQSRL